MLAVKKIEKGDYECDIGIRSKDELGTLAKILAHMSNTIGGFIQEYKKNIEDIMNHVGQGILTISHDHKIHPQYSSVSETIFGRTIKDLELTELLYHTDKEKQSFEDWVKIMFDNNRKIPIKSLLELAEKKIIIKVSDIEKSLLIDYIPIYKKGTKEVYKIMVVLADVSHEKKMEEQHNQEMQEHEQVVKILRNQDGVSIL